MKKLLFIFYFLFFIICSGFSQSVWQWLFPYPQGNIVYKVYPIDANNIIGAASLGTIFKSTNGGLNWVTNSNINNIPAPFEKIYFLNSNTGWVLSSYGVIMKTTNKGDNWTTQYSGTEYFRGIQFINNNTGFIVGGISIGGSFIWKTTNSGFNWTSLTNPNPNANYFSAPCFLDENTGWVISHSINQYVGSCKLYKTTNSGINWTEQLLKGFISKVQFINNNTGYLCGGTSDPRWASLGLLYKTTNGGINWVNQDIDSSGEINFMNFLNESTGWICPWDSIHTTTNGGATWVSKKAYGGQSLSDNDFYNICGREGYIKIYRSTNAGNNFSNISKDDSIGFSDLHFFNENTGVALGGTNAFRTTDGGYNWTKTDLNNSWNYSLHQMSFLDDNLGWIVDSRSNTIFKSTNGGINWFLNNYQMQNDTVRYVCTAQPAIVKIIGNHTIASSSDGGSNWSTLQSSKFGICYFFDVNSGWVFSQGDLLKTTNGGLNWEMNLHQTSYLHFGVFLNFNTGWVTETRYSDTKEDTLLITNNGGANWQTLYIGDLNQVYFRPIFILNENTGWAWGSYYCYPAAVPFIAKTTNGGFNWDLCVYGASGSSIAVEFINENTGWIFGGLLMKTINGGVITSVIQNNLNSTPKEYYLSQNYPNPFNPTTNIRYEIPKNGFVKLVIFDILGREIQTLVNEKQNAGTYEVTFNGSNLSSGIYFYTLSVGDFKETKKFVLLK
jgi:photosystem II stability/assembly factor-like uncharacterized protein